jgi:hypothetical protein
MTLGLLWVGVAHGPSVWHRLRGQVEGGFRVRPRPREASSPRQDWLDPAELGQYLESINQTMERHGFGRNPGLPQTQEEERPAEDPQSLKPRLLVHASRGEGIFDRLSEATGAEGRVEREAAQHWHERSYQLLTNRVPQAQLDFYATDQRVAVPPLSLGMIFSRTTPGHIRAAVLLRQRIDRLSAIAKELS